MFVSIIFTGMGTLFALVGLNILISGDFEGVIFFGMGSLFACVGLWLLKNHLAAKKVRRDIIKNGRKHYGVIVDYSDDTSVYINGIPQANIVVKYMPYDKEMTGHFKTDSTNTSQYPIGSTVCIYEWKNQYAWDKKIVRYPNGATLQEAHEEKTVYIEQ